MAVQADFNGVRRVLGQIIGNFFIDQDCIGKQGYKKALLFCIRVDINEIPSGKDLPTRVQEPEATRLHNLIQDTTVLLVRKFGVAGLLIRYGQIVVTVSA